MVSLVLFRDNGRIWMDTIDDKSVNMAGRGEHEMQRLGSEGSLVCKTHLGRDPESPGSIARVATDQGGSRKIYGRRHIGLQPRIMHLSRRRVKWTRARAG